MRNTWKRVFGNGSALSGFICFTLTLFGAGSRTILALVIIPNCPRPPRTAKNSSEFVSSEQVTSSPLPESNKMLTSSGKANSKYLMHAGN